MIRLAWRRRLGAGTVALAAWASAAPRADAQPSAGIRERAVTDVVAELVAPGLGVDPERVRVGWSGSDATADSVSVVEAGSGRWIATLWNGGASVRRYVRVGVEGDVPVAARALARGEVVAAADVRVETRVRWSAGGPPADDLLDPVGMVASRAVAEGEVLSAPAVQQPLLVRGGEQIEALLVQPGVVMRMRAEALGSARRGESVYVRLTSGRRVTARAVAPGVVRLIPGGA
jgi:flagella basal body P-ring formation protein FlgA